MSGYTYLTSDKRLAQGSAPPLDVGEMPFDLIVLAAQEYQPAMLSRYELMHVPLDDSGPPPTPEEKARIRRAAPEIARRIRSGQRVLVTCWQGRNRSGVLAGLALVELGVPGPAAAQRIRELRNGLTNVFFRDMVIRS